jgi:hypothetical protein
MPVSTTESAAKLRPIVYWRLWLLNALLVSGGLWLCLGTQYGTAEFFGRACAMALLPLIPILVLVGGGGSTIFALSKVFIEKRGRNTFAALALLIGPGLMVTLLLALWGLNRSPAHWLNYICAGNAPVSASEVRVAGYSTFLREEWLAVFHVEQKDFETMAANAKLAPADAFELRKMIEQSSLKRSRLFQAISRMSDLPCFKRVFKAREEKQRGRIFAVFDPATSTAAVVREYRD